MRHIIKTFICNLILLTISLTLSAQNRSQLYNNYIAQYANLAVIQQKEYGIPASITLAQGLLESGAGQSYFSLNSNNHFGIKCHDWRGDRVYMDDDSKGECFRKYNNVLESYRDHSMFLKSKPRYAFLFDIKPTNYEKWAKGLKSAGYATDPAYAYKLIGIIETYDLHRFDLHVSPPNRPINSKNYAINNAIGTVASIPTHVVFKNNGIKFIVTDSGDNFGSIADEFDLSVSKLLEYNDLYSQTSLKAGTQLYIHRKKSKAARNNEIHIVKQGETLYNIAQTYGIKLQKLYDLNKLRYEQGAQIGLILKLR